MKIKYISLIIIGLSIITKSYASESHWGYTGSVGPEHWSKLSTDNSLCSSGKTQSPINLSGFIDKKLLPIEYNYLDGGYEITNNGHTIQLNFKAGSTINIDKHDYELKQLHFHSPSENTVNGKRYPMEMHLVHADKDKNLAVIALLFEEGRTNNMLFHAWESMPNNVNSKRILYSHLNAESLLPDNREYYQFEGSLTTPPCSEGVKWFVIKEIISASKTQIDKFRHIMHHDNNRPLQELNERTVFE
ncbi:MAG: carbonic anhydrase family protein [Methylococcales bacterium]